MRKLVVTENITVDGVIDMAAGWFDPLAKDVDQSDIIATNAEHSAAADALLVVATSRPSETSGPKQTDDPTGVSDTPQPRKQVRRLSHNRRPGLARTPPSSAVTSSRKCKRRAAPGRDIVATGSVQLVQALVGTGLVDEYRLFVFPVVIGRSARLFESEEVSLRLLETRAVHLRCRAAPL